MCETRTTCDAVGCQRLNVQLVTLHAETQTLTCPRCHRVYPAIPEPRASRMHQAPSRDEMERADDQMRYARTDLEEAVASLQRARQLAQGDAAYCERMEAAEAFTQSALDALDRPYLDDNQDEVDAAIAAEEERISQDPTIWETNR